MKKKKILSVLAAVLMAAFLLCGCSQSAKEEISLAKAQNVAELATMKAYYHNVAELSKEKNKSWFNIIDVGYKKMWIEYTGTVELGIDVNKLEIASPDSKGVVTIKIPPATVLGDPDIDADSMQPILTDTGWFTKITAEDKTATLAKAQQTMKKTAEADSLLLGQAQERAKNLLESYIKGVGEAWGETYTVAWEEVE